MQHDHNDTKTWLAYKKKLLARKLDFVEYIVRLLPMDIELVVEQSYHP
jgi:hypothetical protein